MMDTNHGATTYLIETMHRTATGTEVNNEQITVMRLDRVKGLAQYKLATNNAAADDRAPVAFILHDVGN